MNDIPVKFCSLFPVMIKERKERTDYVVARRYGYRKILSELLKIGCFIDTWMILKVRVITEGILTFHMVMFYLKFFVVLSNDISCYTIEESFSFLSKIDVFP